MVDKNVGFITKTIANAIGLFAPKTAMSYVGWRQVLANYTAAKPGGPNKNWNPQNKSADAVLLHDRARLLARARDLERNTAHISGAIDKICNNVIFTGIFPQAKIRDSNSKLKKSKNTELEEIFKLWAEEVNFYEKQELVLRHLWVEGEIFVHFYFDRDLLKKGIVPLNFELLETDFIDHTLNETAENGNQIKAGIEYNQAGKPVNYYIFTEHPGESVFSGVFAQRRKISADNIEHVFKPRRASQNRGISWLASIIMEMRDFSEYQSSERIAARLASAFGAFIESPYPEHQMNHPLMGDEDAVNIDDVPKYFEPGRIDVLPPGMKINVAQYDRPGNSYEPFTKTSLKSASVGTNLSYENFSNDYENSTYSSARQAVLEERRGFRKMQFFLNRTFNGRVWNKFINFAVTAGIINIQKAVPVKWQNPGWSWIDPAKDAKGAKMELEMGINTRRRLAAERGFDWDEEIDDLAEEEKIIRDKEIKPEDEGE